MNKAIWWIIVIVVVAGGIYYSTTKSAPTEPAAPASEGAAGQGTFNTAPPTSGQQSLAGLMALGTAQQCAFSQNVVGSSNSGTVYVSAGKVRGDFTSVADGQTTQAHMISDGQDVYTWIEGINLGFKATMSEGQAATPGTPASGGVDVNQQLNYDCSPWSVDNSKFAVPTSIQFNAMGAGMMTPPTQ